MTVIYKLEVNQSNFVGGNIVREMDSGETNRTARGEARDPKAAPEPLDLVRRFVNTRNRMRDYDLIESPKKAARWLTEEGHALDSVSDDELRCLHTLREGLRAVLTAHTLGVSEESRRAATELDGLCETVALQPGFSPKGEPRLVAASRGVEGFIEDLLSAAVWARHTGIWEKLKACANEECRWVFYDHSKNRSGNWCVMEICGSRAKMRAYRKRRARGG